MLQSGQDELVKELTYVIAKYDDQIAAIKQWQWNSDEVKSLQRRRDMHYERLCKIDGLTDTDEVDEAFSLGDQF